MSRPADLRRWAGEAISLLEGVAAERAGGQPATVRTVRLCGTAGLVAFSMIGGAQAVHSKPAAPPREAGGRRNNIYTHASFRVWWSRYLGPDYGL